MTSRSGVEIFWSPEGMYCLRLQSRKLPFWCFHALYIYLYLSIYLSVCLSVRPSIRPSVCLSVCPFVRRPPVRRPPSAVRPSAVRPSAVRPSACLPGIRLLILLCVVLLGRGIYLMIDYKSNKNINPLIIGIYVNGKSV